MSRMPMMGMGMPTGYGPGMMESQMGMGAQMPMPPEEPMPKKRNQLKRKLVRRLKRNEN